MTHSVEAFGAATTLPSPWWADAAIVIELNPWCRDADTGTLLVGLGDGQAETTGVSLNHKGGPAGLRSVSSFVAAADAQQWQRWRERLATPGAIRRIVIEDLSLDTCLALLLFGRGLQGGPALSYEAQWVDYVTAWECGQYRDGSDLAQSTACLVSALGHSYLPAALDEVVHGGFAAEGLYACLRLLETLLQTPPFGAVTLHTRDADRARAQLQHERQLYELMLQRAVRCQLMLELDGAARHVLVDALFVSEMLPSGVLKVMARTDGVHAWTHKGFTFLGVHRPGERGNGNDMVLSVDPDSALNLRSLWHELERLEDERWAGARPSDAPRKLVSYRHPDDPLRLRAGAPNEPWYDTGGSHTLLAAPKNVAAATPGSRLDWCADVVPAVWRLYFLCQIAPFVRMEPAGAVPAAGKRIQRVTRLAAHDAAEGVHPDMALLETPTFHAWLASHSYGETPAASPFALPPAQAIEVLQLGECIAVVHSHGMTWFVPQDQPRAFAGLRDAAEQVAALHASYQVFLDDYRAKLAGWQAALSGHDAGAEAPRDLHAWTHEIHAFKVRALQVSSNASLLRHDYDENRLGETLQRMWGLSQQRGELAASIDGIDELMRHAIAARTERRQRIYGSILSGIGLGLLATHVWEPIKERLTMNGYEWQLLLFKEQPAPGLEQLRHIAHETAFYETLTIVVIFGFALLGFILYWLFGLRGEEHH